jgi:hypothetical protein
MAQRRGKGSRKPRAKKTDEIRLKRSTAAPPKEQKKKKVRTRVQKHPRSQYAASQSKKRSKKPLKKPARSRRKAPSVVSSSVARRLAAAAAQRYIAADLQAGLKGETRGAPRSDAEWVARQAIAAGIFAREQSGEQVSDREHTWFDGYACPSGRVAKHYSRLRWIDHGLGGKMRAKLSTAYEEGGDEALDDAASRISSEMHVPLREVYTLFWSG